MGKKEEEELWASRVGKKEEQDKKLKMTKL